MYHSFVGFSNIHNMLFSKDMIFVFYTFEVYTVLWKKCKLNLCYPIDLYKIDMICFGIIVCLFFVLYFFIHIFSLPETAMKKNKEKLEEKQREQAEKKKDYDQTRYSSLPQEVSLFVSWKVKTKSKKLVIGDLLGTEGFEQIKYAKDAFFNFVNELTKLSITM